MIESLGKIRELRFLSQHDLAEISGVAVSTINRLEKGTHNPRPRTLRKLAVALDVSVEELKDSHESTDQLPKSDEVKELLESILDSVRSLREYLEGQRDTSREEMFDYSFLSPREVDVLRLITQGMSNREIASALFLSPHTVAAIVAHILSKTGTRNRAEAVALALTQGLIRTSH